MLNTWRYHHEYTHAPAGAVPLPPATTGPHTVRSETGQLRLESRHSAPVLRPGDRHPQSSFFSVRIGVGDVDQASVALARGRAGGTPGARKLPGITGVAQNPPDRKGADAWQAIGRVAQGMLQGGKRPRRGAILRPVR